MYLARIEIENFRIFGSRDQKKHCAIDLDPGLNVFVGENDSGKTCLVDALRLLVGSVTDDYFPITEEDFHWENSNQVSRFRILGEFRGLDVPEGGALLEYLSVEKKPTGDEFYLRVWLDATLRESVVVSPRRSRVQFEYRAGSDEEGKEFRGPARQLLRATYLKPLRDAVSELAPKRGSRLSRVLRAYPLIEGHEKSDWTSDHPESDPQTLVGIMRKAEYCLRMTDVVQKAEKHLNDEFLTHLSLTTSPITSSLLFRAHELQQILERMELSVAGVEPNTTRGLGVHNVLFIAAELLASAPNGEPDLPLVLIEEPEAHLHPQLQLCLIEYIRSQSKTAPSDPTSQLQTILTTHSPNLASKVGLRNVVFMARGQAYRMGPECTKLDTSDYEFLERFLDVTKANLFFAAGVLIVEGDAEALLLPALAGLLGKSLTASGVSIVNVGHRGLFRYARIFQRKDARVMPIRVACLADRDIPPKAAKSLLKNSRKTEDEFTPAEIADAVAKLKQHDCAPVKTLVSPSWTLEYDLACTPLAKYVHAAVSLATRAKKDGCLPAADIWDEIIENAYAEHKGWRDAGTPNHEIACNIYEPLIKKHASKAETAQCLAKLLSGVKLEKAREDIPKYLVDAIDYVTEVNVATSPVSSEPGSPS
jgi:putative ATP-dependent endonuclease of the OLD family